MIVKSLTRKTASFGQILGYLNRADQKGPPLFHNFRTNHDDLVRIATEFSENARHLKARSNGIALYHEILSFAAGDRPRVTPEILNDLAQKYLVLRAPRALAYAKAHLNKDNPHIHIIISANDFGSARRIRISRGEFKRIKVELERYQKERYPELVHSLVQERGRSQDRGGEREWKRGEVEQEKRVYRTVNEIARAYRLKVQQKEQPTQKESIHEQVAACLAAADSHADLVARLQACGLEFYQRGKTAGVMCTATGRRHRLTTLGLQQDFEKTVAGFGQLARRLKELRQIELEKSSRPFREYEFRQELVETVRLDDSRLTDQVRERVVELRRVIRDRRKRTRERGRGLERPR